MANSYFKIAVSSLIIGLASGFGGAYFYVNYLWELPLASQEVKTVVEEKRIIEESGTITAIEKVNPAVISVVAKKDLDFYYRDPFNFFEVSRGKIQNQEVGGGSAFVISADGMAITNYHVVADEKAQYSALNRNGEKFDVKILAADDTVDIALIQLLIPNQDGEKKPENLKMVNLGKSENLKVGQRVLAIGNALGEYDNTVTSGIVSGVGRKIFAGDLSGNTEQLFDLIQTDAAINPGNSGGPLVNLDGEVVGVNVAIDRNGANIGFALPIDDVNFVVDSYLKNGRIVRPALGVRYINLDQEKAEELKIAVTEGALLVGDEEEGLFAVIPGSSADKAGLKIKDVILEVNGKKIEEAYSLREAIAHLSVGEKVTMKVWRSGKEIELEAVLEELPNSESQ